MENCKNCNQNLTGKFCSDCGQPATLKRIDSHYIQHEIEHVLHLDRGIFYTIKELLIRPGKNVREFFSDNRNRLVKPIIFIIVCSLVYTLIDHYFHIEQSYVEIHGEKGSAYNSINKWMQDHYGYANIIMGICIAPWLKLFFRKYDYNFFEILILLCFIMGVGMLIFSVFVIAEGLTHFHVMKVAGWIGILYCSWAIADFYDKKKIIGYPKSILCYLLGMQTFALTIFALGYIVDLIKH
jgi:hypothetical protein